MVRFVDNFQYDLPKTSLREQHLKELDNESILYLFSEARRLINAIPCDSDVTVTFKGTHTKRVYANIKGPGPDVVRIYKAMEKWFRENAMKSSS